MIRLQNTNPRKCATFGAVAVVLASCALLAVSSAGADTARVENTNRVELVNVATGRRADVMWASGQDGQNVFLWRNNKSASQELRPDQHGPPPRQLGARVLPDSGEALGQVPNARPDASPTSGTGGGSLSTPAPPPPTSRLNGYEEAMNGHCDDNALCIDKGWRIIKNRWTGRCLDTANPSGRRPPEQAVLQLWTCIKSTDDWNADNQVWKILDPATGQPIYHPR